MPSILPMPLLSIAWNTSLSAFLLFEIASIAYGVGKYSGNGAVCVLDSLLMTCLNVSWYPSISECLTATAQLSEAVRNAEWFPQLVVVLLVVEVEWHCLEYLLHILQYALSFFQFWIQVLQYISVVLVNDIKESVVTRPWGWLVTIVHWGVVELTVFMRYCWRWLCLARGFLIVWSAVSNLLLPSRDALNALRLDGLTAVAQHYYLGLLRLDLAHIGFPSLHEGSVLAVQQSWTPPFDGAIPLVRGSFKLFVKSFLLFRYFPLATLPAVFAFYFLSFFHFYRLYDALTSKVVCIGIIWVHLDQLEQLQNIVCYEWVFGLVVLVTMFGTIVWQALL